MGTYGVTHVKKDNKIIALSNSYDGYMGGGMGQANIVCIKYLSTPILKSLFDQFTASSKVPVDKANTIQEEGNDEDDELELTQRQIQDVLYRVEQDTKNPEAVEWMKDVLGDSIRTSVCGFAPMLYLNINNHYGRDYDYANYVIDLDNEELTSNGLKIPFETIRNASMNHIMAFCNNVTELLPKKLRKEAEELFYEEYTEEDAPKVNEIINAYFSIDESKLKKYYDKKEEERQNYLNNRGHSFPTGNDNDLDDEQGGEYIGGYSIHNGQVNAPVLRSILTFMQKLKKAMPETAFLENHSDWGLDENYSDGGFRTFSPMSNDHLMNAIHDRFVQALQSTFQVRFNIFSSTGKWSSDVKEEEGVSPFFMEVVPGPQKSCLSLKEIEQFEDKDIILGEIHPYLAYYANYSEVRELILAPNANISSPNLWVYMALLNEDKEVFEKVYPLAQEVIKSLDKKTEKSVCNKYLQSLSDAKTINELVFQFAQEFGKNIEPSDSQEFIKYLQTTTFFKDVAQSMNKAEKARYGVEDNGTSDSTETKPKKKKMK